jgi:hypothetical protein
METTQWWYADGQEQRGPISEEELKTLLHSGELSSSTPVWHEGMEDWAPAGRVGLVPPPTPPQVVVVQEGPTPWRRFWARMIDIFLISFFSLSPFLLLIWIPIEAAFLATWGYTPGKWFLGIRVTDQEGKKLNFDTAIHRAFLVWLKGLCLGIYIGWIVSCPIAYRKLKREGKTSWDKDLLVKVEQEEVPTGRKIFLAILLFFYFVLSASIMMMIMSSMHMN